MLTNRLTDAAIRRAKHGEKSVKLFDGGGLYLELHPKGSRYWRMKYRHAGAERRLAFGVYPEVTLAEARSCRAASGFLRTCRPRVVDDRSRRQGKHGPC
jgi:hypothetical protein